MGKKKVVKRKKVVKKKSASSNGEVKAPKKGGALDRIKRAASGQTIQQDLIPDAFPDRVDELERLAQRRAKLKDKAAKLNEEISVIGDEIAVEMIDQGLHHYKCYTLRAELIRPEDIVRVRRIPEKEATPYQPV